MSATIPAIAVVTRAFGNSRDLEGVIVTAGTKFAIGAPIDGLRVLKPERYLTLRRLGLVRPLGPTDEITIEAIPSPKRADTPQAVEVPPSRPPERAAARRTQEPNPPAPIRLNPPGQGASIISPNGSPVAALSLAVGQALSTSNTSSKRHGRRKT